MLSPVRQDEKKFKSDCDAGPPFGYSRFRNVFQHYCSDGNMSSGDKATKVLLLGCGDLRNTFQATTCKNPLNLEIHLNDCHLSVLARNVIILKIVSAHDFNPDNEADFGFLWDVWYNLDWPEETRKRFTSIVNKLMKEKLPDNVSIPSKSHLKKLKSLWSSWRVVSSKKKPESESLSRKVWGQRNQYLLDMWNEPYPGYLQEKARRSNADLFTTSVNEMAKRLQNNEDFIGLAPCVRNKIYAEMIHCYRDGSSRLKKIDKPVCVNPTMLNAKTHDYESFCLGLFDGYLPMETGELITSAEQIMTQSCSEILRRLVSSYRGRMPTVKIFCHLGEAVEFCYLDENQFDVIDCSDFVSCVGLANVVVACRRKLSDDPNAVLYTKITTDCRRSANTVVETALCTPLSLIPTVYGLRLAHHVELRDSAVDMLRWSTVLQRRPVTLCWQKVPNFLNMKLVPSPDLNRCLTKLAKLCHPTTMTTLSPNPPSKLEKCRAGEVFYTPLTFNYVLDSMMKRLGRDCRLVDLVDVAPQFMVARKTLEDWKNGKKMIKLSAAGVQLLMKSLGSQQPYLLVRLVFIRKASCKLRPDLSGPDVHFIDNLQFEYNYPSKGIDLGTVSFLLASEHGFDETYDAFLFNAFDGEPLLRLESLKSMRVEEYDLPYPFDQSQCHLPLDSKKGMHMKVESCIESEKQYTVRIVIESTENLSGLKIATNEQAPCESCHDVTVSLTQPSAMTPLSLTFPFPILAKKVQATLHPKRRQVDLLLNKALQEPWPCEFHSKQSKWSVDELAAWKNKPLHPDERFKTVAHHLACQFVSVEMSLICSLYSNGSALDKLRIKLGKLMIGTAQCVSFGRNHERYLLKLHRPLLTSPTGTPMLLSTALYDRGMPTCGPTFFTANPTDAPKGKETEHHATVAKVFSLGTPNVSRLVFHADSDEEFQLFRFLLRLNSTRIEPSKGQKKTVPLGGSSPWLATYLSFLYQDSVLARSCSACQKFPDNLKFCNRCRSTVYCSAECQRAHRPTHKHLCKKL